MMVRRGLAVLAVLLLVPQADGGAAPAQEVCFGARATITGTPAADVIRGTAGPDVIYGAAGDDVVLAGAGNDLVCGGPGGDALAGDAGDDRIQGDAGLDGLYGGLGDDEIIGGGDGDFAAYAFSATGVRVDLAAGGATGEGTDRIREVESIIGSPHADTLLGDSGENIITGMEGNDVMDGRAGVLDAVAFATDNAVNASLATGRATGDGTDRISGTEALFAGEGDDTLTGNARENHFSLGAGNDVVRGGGGSDTVLFYTSRRPVKVNLVSGRATGEGSDRLSGIEKLLGSVFDDTIVGDAQPNALFGGAGNDVVAGGAGDDQLFGEVISDPPGNDRLQGGAGNDILSGLFGDDLLDGGAGQYDRAAFVFSPAPVTASLATDSATGEGRDRMSGVEGLAGSHFADTLTGDAGANLLTGALGDDRISAGGGDDFVAGADGNDTLDGAAGRDYCLDTQRGAGCEITGLPGASPAARVPAAATATSNEELGQPSCEPARASAARTLAGALKPKPRRRARHGTSISPPPRVSPARPRAPLPPRSPAAAVAATQFATSASWRPTLFRYNGRRWVRYRQFPRLTATIDFGDAAVWVDAKGRPVKQIRANVGRGRFAWVAELRQAGSRTSDWAEPHVNRAAGQSVFAKFCTFTR